VRAGDYSFRAWEVRERAYASIPAGALRLVAPSRWLAEKAGQSALFAGWETDVVANGIDLGRFSPVDRGVARRKLGLNEREFVALFLADSGGNRRKGLPVLEDALRGMERRDGRTLLVAGEFKDIAADGWKILPLGYVRGAGELSTVYSAADVFVHPAIEDNLPSTVLESLACGTPVAGFRVGGIPEIITDGEIGALCEPSAAGLRKLLSDAEGWRNDDRRRAACRRRAEAFSIPAMVEGYRGIYSSFGR
jgi:glycosyltransferase involved in cell wall biosynthesis